MHCASLLHTISCVISMCTSTHIPNQEVFLRISSLYLTSDCFLLNDQSNLSFLFHTCIFEENASLHYTSKFEEFFFIWCWNTVFSWNHYNNLFLGCSLGAFRCWNCPIISLHVASLFLQLSAQINFFRYLGWLNDHLFFSTEFGCFSGC